MSSMWSRCSLPPCATRAPTRHRPDEAHMTTNRSGSYPAGLARLFDIVFASLGLVVLSPVIVLVSIAIVAETGWPILFAQTRLGVGGRHFRMYKFRKFRPD